MTDDKSKEPDDDWGDDLEFRPRDDGRPGPPDDWDKDSWRDFRRGEWWYRFGDEDRHRLDPPPVLMLGHKGGEFVIVTAAREMRSFTSAQLHGRGGFADLFAGDKRWAVRHYPSFDRDGNPTGRPNVPPLMEAIIAGCVAKGLYDGSQPFRSVGTWRETKSGLPVLHCGDRILHDGRVYRPGELIGTARYVLGPHRAAPALEMLGRYDYKWLPAPLAHAHEVIGHLDEWHWDSPEALELCAGILWCNMLGDLPRWKVHTFLRALSGGGKSTLIRYISALLGPAAHPPERTYSKAYLEERFGHTAATIILEEAETDPDMSAEQQRMAQIQKLMLLLSDDGATGGRFKREIDLHGPVMMAATLTSDWRATFRNRVVLLVLRSLRSRTGHRMLEPKEIEALIARAGELSAGLRAAALSKFESGLFEKNLAKARARILGLGGDARDADTLGHAIAGWATMTKDDELTEDEVGKLDRFAPWIVSLANQEDGGDDAMELLNVLLGLPAQNWRGGDQLTIGQLVARGREPDNHDFRRALLPYGMRLEKLPLETWKDAWLAIANKHPGLDRLLSDYPQYQGLRRSQILAELKIRDEVAAKPTDRPLRFAGPQSRGLLIDPRLLPTMKDDIDAVGEQPVETLE